MNMNGSSSSGRKTNEVGKIRRGEALDFSSLPADVLAYISSLLTSKEVLNICFSCKKLKHLTTSIPNIEITEAADGCPTKKKEFVKSISRFLAKHNTLVRKFQLSFHPEEKYKSHVFRWLSSVVKYGIEELDLMLYNRVYLEIPVSLLTIGTLKVLRLRHCKVDLPSIAGLKSLKSLLLGAMPISDYEMGLFCCHCESLQHLTLEKCFGFEEIKIVDPRCKLEKLVLDGHCLSLSRLNILRLKTLVVRRRNMNFSFINCPNIDELVLSRVGAGGITRQESVNMKANIINRLGNVRSMQLAGWAFECFAYWALGYHQFANLEVLNLDINICDKNLRQLGYMIYQAHSLKTLFISSIIEDRYARDYAFVTNPNFKEMSAYFFDNKYKWSPRLGFGNSALQDVVIKNFRGSMYEVKLIYCMLGDFPHLRVLKVTPMMGIDEDLLGDFAKLFSRFPRGSANVCMLLGSTEVLKAEEVRSLIE